MKHQEIVQWDKNKSRHQKGEKTRALQLASVACDHDIQLEALFKVFRAKSPIRNLTLACIVRGTFCKIYLLLSLLLLIKNAQSFVDGRSSLHRSDPLLVT